MVDAPAIEAAWYSDELPTTDRLIYASPDFVKDTYGIEAGLAMPVFGGDLYGWTRIGPASHGGLVTDDGVPLLSMAEHQDAQCMQVLTLDGRVGVTWPGSDYLARYSHMQHFIEASAAWTSVIGWSYADVIQVNPGLVVRALGDVELVPEASGDLVRWWLGNDVAVYSEPRLTESFERPPHVLVLASSAEHARVVGRELRRAIRRELPEVPAGWPEIPAAWTEPPIETAFGSVVGRDFPEVPVAWGPPRHVATTVERLADALGQQGYDMVGLSSEEIEEVRDDQGLARLPATYVEFLQRMGRVAGRLLVGTDAFYPTILGLRPEAGELLAMNGVSDLFGQDDLVFAMHQGYQFYWMATEPDDPPVFMYSEGVQGVSRQ